MPGQFDRGGLLRLLFGLGCFDSEFFDLFFDFGFVFGLRVQVEIARVGLHGIALQAFFFLRFTEEAEGEFRHAIAVDPTSSAPLIALAEAYASSGDNVDARKTAEAALRIRESFEVYVILARIDLRENKLDAAGQNVDHALHLDPGNPAAHNLKNDLAAKLAEKAQPLSQP